MRGSDGIFLNIDPPTTTHQQKKVAVVGGRPRFYEPPRLREARTVFAYALKRFAPAAPMTGALYLKAVWRFPRGRHKNGEWKITKPDTDNLQKLLKDCMTDCGFWADDKLVAREHIEKLWSDKPGIEITVTKLAEELTG